VLVSRQAELAEASIDDPAAEQRYHEVCAEQRDVLAEVARLELAVAHAERRTAAEAKERAAGERAAKRAEVGRLLDERLAPAQQLAQAIADAATAFHDLLDRNDAVAAAWPGVAPMEAKIGPVQIQRLVEFELYRRAGKQPITGRPLTIGDRPGLPGGRAADLSLNPAANPHLLDEIRSANTRAKEILGASHG